MQFQLEFRVTCMLVQLMLCRLMIHIWIFASQALFSCAAHRFSDLQMEVVNDC